MSTVKLDRKVPAFEAASTGDGSFSLAACKGRHVVLYFYPKDNTPGCTREGQDFRDHHARFKRNNTVVVGVSRDSLKSHENFKTKQQLPFELLSDPDETLCRMFDVIKEKNMYGRKVMGVERSTFLIDASGKVAKVWKRVQVDGHDEQVIEAIKAL